MILELITIGFMVGSYVYHRMTEVGPQRPKDRITAPTLGDATPVPLVYGRCRINRPLIVWSGNTSVVQRVGQPDGGYTYRIDATFVLGTPFPDGDTKLCGMYLDDHPMAIGIFAGAGGDGLVANLAGIPSYYAADNSIGITDDDPRFTTFPQFEFGDGNSSQTMVGSQVAATMILAGVDATLIPGFRNYMTFNVFGMRRNEPRLPAIAFEVSTYPLTSLDQAKVGVDANPADVIRDLLCGSAKLERPTAQIDYESFRQAAETLSDEGHGYSRCIEDTTTADEMIQDVLRQIDAVLYEEPTDGVTHLKLIRNDWNPQTVPQITVDNCEGLYDFACGGWTGIPNKIRVVFPSRVYDYVDKSTTAQNGANATGQNSETNELVLNFPGCCTYGLAGEIAARELAFHSRPITKCRAVVDRSFLRTVPGDVVALIWPEYGISSMYFRVANVERGELTNGKITLWLIQDVAYVWRNVGALTEPGNGITMPAFPTEAVE